MGHNHYRESHYPNCIEMQGTGSANGGYIDFHYGQSDTDYTSRIGEFEEGKLTIDSTNGLDINGLLKVNAPIFGYNYTMSKNAPAFVFDKSGPKYTGIGSNGENDTILFAPVNTTDYSWVSNYNQRWAFQGSVTADTYIKAKQGFTTDETMNMYAELNNEINFGGTNNSNTVYFGYREKDSKPIPTQFVFGGATGTAKIIASNIPTYSYSNGTLTITM